MAGFLDVRLDFIYFLHGIALALLASSAWGLSHLENRRTWWWVGWFAGAQAAYVWFKAVSNDGVAGMAWDWVRYVILFLSFFCLFEVARQKLASRIPSLGKPWAFTLIAAAGISGIVFRLTWLCPVVGLVSAIFFGAELFSRMREGKPGNNTCPLGLCGVAVSVYAAISGFVLDDSLLYAPLRSNEVPSDSRFAMTLGSAALAGVACWAVGRHYSLLHHRALGAAQPRSWSRKRNAQLAVFIVLVALCWFSSERAVELKDADMREEILRRTELIVAAIPPDLVKGLEWNDADLAKPNYQELKSRMMALVHANRDLRFVMLTGLHEGKACFLVDSEKPDSKDYSPPGDPYTEASPAYLQGLASHQPFVLGPVTDHWGVWIISSAPIGFFGPDGRWVAAEVDIAGTHWSDSLRGARLPVILIMLVFSLLLLTFSYHQERIHESLAKLSASEQRNSSIVEGSPNCVQMIDLQGCCVAINQNGAALLNRPRVEVEGKPFVDLWPSFVQKSIRTALDNALNGRPSMLEADYLRPDGETIIWKIVLTPVRSSCGDIECVVAILIDISDFRFSEKALVAAKESAEAANKTKSEFLAVMSHEIRTPLGGVIGMLNVLKKHPMSAEQQLYTDLAHENAENLLGLLDDILDSAKVEAGKLTIETIPFESALEFSRVLEPMRLRAEGKGLDFTWNIAPDLPAVLRGDPTRLRQVLANLLSNALKFTEKGGIQTSITATLVGTDKAVLRIQVKDTGIGISHEKLVRLFRRFEQADLSTTRRFGGTGLGLSIVKSLAELMHGDVTVTSELGAGSAFTFMATLGVGTLTDLGHTGSRSSQNAACLPKHKARLHVLCAEDDSTNQVAAEFLVKQMGHTIEFVENGKLAVEWLSTQRASVVLMDNRMPIMDGFQATHIIRDTSSPVLDHNVYIIANTANASSGYRERCLATGMNDYLTKPLREVELHAAFERAIEFYEKRGGILPPMREEPHLQLSSVAKAPEADNAVPKGMSADELLAMLGDEQEKPADPTANFTPEALNRITEQYFKETPLRLAEMREAIARKDFASLARAAHSIKSSSRYVKAETLSNLGAEMERLADAQQMDEIPGLFAQADREFGALRPPTSSIRSV